MIEHHLNQLAARLSKSSRAQGSPFNAYHARAEIDAVVRRGDDPVAFVEAYEKGR